MLNIKKRNGKMVKFNEEKIEHAIYNAFLDKEFAVNGKHTYSESANENAKEMTERVTVRISKDFDEGTVLSVEDVQDVVEDVLMKSRFKDVAKSYIRYRHSKALSRKKFSDNQSSFIKTIEKITFEDSEDNDFKRENANVDGNSAMGTMLQFGATLSKSFAETHLVNDLFSSAHKSGDIHIHDLDFYAMGTTTCLQLDLDRLFKNGFSTGHGFIREPQSIQSYSSLSAIAIQANQNDQHGGQSINAFDYYLAPGVLKTFKKALKEAIDDFVDFDYDSDISTESLKEVFDYIDDEVKTMSITTKNLITISRAMTVGLDMSHENATKVLTKSVLKALKVTEKSTFQAMESLVHNLNTMNSRAGSQVPFSSINFGTDTSPEGRMISEKLLLAMDAGLGRGETAIFPILIFKVKEGINYNKEDINYDLFKLAMKVSAKRLFPNFSFLDAPFNLEFYEEGNYHSEVGYMGCRTRVMSNEAGPAQSSSRGNLSFTSVNLPRLGIKHGLQDAPDMESFYKELEGNIGLVKDQLLERYKYQCQKKVKNSPFLMGQGMWLGSDKLNANDTLEDVLKHGTLSVGFIGLAECLVALTGKHHGESEESQKLGLEIIGFMREKLDEFSKEYSLNFSLIATPAEGLSGRFIKIDKEVYGEIEGVTDREYYTNSFHVPVYYQTIAYKKIVTEAPYHALTNAGHITYVEVDGDPLQNLDAFEKIVRLMKESGIGYGSINHPVDRDPICGHTGIIGDTCPQCGREEGNDRFERIRRVTGYLVGTLDRFNDSKQAEVRDRVKHM